MGNVTEALKAIHVARQHFDILAEALSEIKASHDGGSVQPIGEILSGAIEEIWALPSGADFYQIEAAVRAIAEGRP